MVNGNKGTRGSRPLVATRWDFRGYLSEIFRLQAFLKTGWVDEGCQKSDGTGRVLCQKKADCHGRNGMTGPLAFNTFFHAVGNIFRQDGFALVFIRQFLTCFDRQNRFKTIL